MSQSPQEFERLLAGHELLEGLGATDLREMSKFDELTNLAGLAAHAIRHPWPESWQDPLEPTSGPAAMPERLRAALEAGLRLEPAIRVRGRMAPDAPGGGWPVAIDLPMRGAHLAAALLRMLGPEPEDAGQEPAIGDAPGQPLRAPVRLLLWPEPLAPSTKGRSKRAPALPLLVGRAWWPESRQALVVGSDDPTICAELLLTMLEHAFAEEADAASGPSPWPAGIWSVHREDGGRPARPIPRRHDATVSSGDGEWPVWADPLLPAAWLAATQSGRRAALEPGALLFGVEVDAEGRIPAFEDATAPEANPHPVEIAGSVVLARHHLQ